MNKSLQLGVCGVLLPLASLVEPLQASPVLGLPVASYSGSYSVVTTAPVAEGIASVRLALGPLFADCDAAGQCTQLLQLDGLGASASGSVFNLNNSATVLAAVSNGQLDVLSLAMNFGPLYSPLLSGGGIGIFDTPLEAANASQPVDAITFTIDHLLFQDVSTPLGFGTQAELDFTLALRGPAMRVPGPLVLPVGPTPTFGNSEQILGSMPTPEPSGWLLMVVGAGALFISSRRYAS